MLVSNLDKYAGQRPQHTDYDMTRYICYFCFLSLVLLPTDFAFAWGERGHDLVTRVAVRHLAKQTDAAAEINRPFSFSAHKLSHLSNVPDIVWRADYMSEKDRQLNSPTHYMDLDLIYSQPKSLYDMDREFSVMRTKAIEKGIAAESSVGTAPWRVLQLHHLMTEALRGADKAESRREMVDRVNDALLYGGLMSHFVGDLANPHHTTVDHDGWGSGNGGLHAYFETMVVAAFPLSFADTVMQSASRDLLEINILSQYPESQREEIRTDPTMLIFALAVESHQNLPALVALDNEHSLLERSQNKDNGLRKPAVRKPPSAVIDIYRDFAAERIALGASVLSQLWFLAWQEAGEPDLASYQSYVYPVRPDFIEPDYFD